LNGAVYQPSKSGVMTMYDLLIVDDEEYVRNGIKNTYPWEQYGFRVIGTADNGYTALQLIDATRPHVVITDIMMPVMDGLAFAERVKDRYPAIQIVLLSAYNEFVYAQRGIRYGVREYLLKPLDEGELEKTFRALANRLDFGDIDSGHTVDAVAYKRGKEQDNYITQAKQYVAEHFARKITLDDIAKALFITPAYFSVMFKKETGQNFIDYVAEVRVKKAKELLRRSDYRVKEIAIRVGYDDYAYFCKIFRKIEGITPLEFRSNHKF